MLHLVRLSQSNLKFCDTPWESARLTVSYIIESVVAQIVMDNIGLNITWMKVI